MRGYLLVALVALVLVLPMITTVESQGAVMSPDRRGFDLVRGTRAEQLPTVTYRGTYTLGTSSWTHCTASVTLSGPMSGIQAVLAADPVCNRLSERTIEVVVQVKFIGLYTGGTFTYTPITSARAIVYNYTDVLTTVTFSVEQMTVSEVVIVSVSLSETPVTPGSIAYRVVPTNLTVGSIVYIVPFGDVNLVMTLDRIPTVPPSFVARALAMSATGSGTASTRVDFVANETSKSFTLAGVALESAIHIDIIHNDIPVYSGVVDISSVIDLGGYGKAVFTTDPPSLVWKQNSYYAYGAVIVLELKSASLEIQFSANGMGDRPKEVSTTGRVDFEVPLSRDRPLRLDGEYVVTFTPQMGNPITVRVPFSVSYEFTSGRFLTFVFFTLFNSLLGVSLFIFFFGFFMRRVDLMGYGMLVLILAALIFGIPTIMSNVISAVVATGIEDPIGLQTITMMNLGEKLDQALEYISQKGKFFANLMFGAATTLLIVLGVLAGLVIGLGVAGIFTGGALSIFIGQTLGAFAAHLVSVIVMLYLASFILNALVTVFPILLNIIIMLLVFTALLQAVFAVVSHNLTPLINTVISLSFVIMLVFMTPLVLATLDRLYYNYTIWVGIGPVGFSLPLDPFMILAIAFVQIAFLTMVLAMAFHRLMVALHGFGSFA